MDQYSSDQYRLTRFATDLEQDSLVSSFVNPGRKVLRLRLDDVGLGNLRGESDMELDSRVVSFIGKTHAGKSHLVQELLSSGYQACAQPQKGDRLTGSLAPTTGDCCFFRGLASDTALLVLDMEGEDAGDHLPVQVVARFPDLEQGKLETYKKEYSSARRDATREHLPRLAYAVSDVVVYVTTGSLAQNDIVRDLERIALSCSEGVTCGFPPSLLVVLNKQSVDDVEESRELDPNGDLMRTEWLQAHGGQTHILPFFTDVRIVAIPSRGKRSEDIYNICLCDFRGAVEAMLNQRVSARQMRALKLTSRVWTMLFRNVVEQFHSVKGLNIDQSYLEAILLDQSEEDGIVSKMLHLCRILQTTSNHVAITRGMLCSFLALFFAEHVACGRSALPNLAQHTPTICQGFLNSCWTPLMEMFWNGCPCVAVRDAERCTAVRSTHNASKHTPEKYIAQADESLAMRWFKRGLRTVRNILLSWEGQFETDDFLKFEDMSRHCRTKHFDVTLNAVSRDGVFDRKLIYNQRRYLFQNVPHDARELSSDMNLTKICLYCFKGKEAEFRELRCRHQICYDCFAFGTQGEENISCPNCTLMERCHFSSPSPDDLKVSRPLPPPPSPLKVPPKTKSLAVAKGPKKGTIFKSATKK